MRDGVAFFAFYSLVTRCIVGLLIPPELIQHRDTETGIVVGWFLVSREGKRKSEQS